MADQITEKVWIGDQIDAMRDEKKYDVIIDVRSFIQEGSPSIINLDLLSDVIERNQRKGNRVLVHCTSGMQRAPLVVAWWMAKYRNMKLDDAYRYIQSKRSVHNMSDWIPWNVRRDRNLL